MSIVFAVPTTRTGARCVVSRPAIMMMLLLRMVLKVPILVIELLIGILLVFLQELSQSKTLQRFGKYCAYNLAGTFTAHVLSHPGVQHHVANTIVTGMNVFLQQPNLDDIVKETVVSLSKSQPDLARKQGEDLPVILGSFLSGVLRLKKKVPESPRSLSPTTTTHPNETDKENNNKSILKESTIGHPKVLLNLPSFTESQQQQQAADCLAETASVVDGSVGSMADCLSSS